MGTSRSFVARLESTAADVKISTVERYADILGCVVHLHLISVADGDAAPSVVVH
jgi:predicted transcriptional regulator